MFLSLPGRVLHLAVSEGSEGEGQQGQPVHDGAHSEVGAQP